MQELKVVGAELGALIVADRNEEEYRLIVDDSFHVHLRRAKPAGAPIGGNTKISPREVQAHIRSGLSAEDVAAVTGASLEYVQRFEGPVMAEREHIVGTALGVAVAGEAFGWPQALGMALVLGGVVAGQRRTPPAPAPDPAPGPAVDPAVTGSTTWRASSGCATSR